MHREHHRELQESETEVVWACEETRSRILRKTDTGYGTIWETKKGMTTAELNIGT